jgi:hypothetical protein
MLLLLASEPDFLSLLLYSRWLVLQLSVPHSYTVGQVLYALYVAFNTDVELPIWCMQASSGHLVSFSFFNCFLCMVQFPIQIHS